ncbi:MAG: hypothetical protein HYR88_11650 [Verrucomicrobia bacterium]|nr:hypothetical protein [Verrucomicrobiota bacterium]MBI3868562.1 hypothetical protein [Verrucomicrobiota bacterium]
MNRIAIGCLSAFLVFAADSSSRAAEKLFAQDFEKADIGKVPDGFLVLDGAFAVADDQGNRVLELPGAPLDTFGVLFGPTRKDGLSVSARILGTAKGRRFPVLGVGLNGAVPYRLQVTPSKKSLELYKGDDLLASTPYVWDSGSWTHFRLQLIAKKEGGWQLSGKAWKQGAVEPAEWLLMKRLEEEPVPGQASVWGKPYAETAIHFDDLVVTSVEK